LASHEFFQKRGFLYVQTPIITGSDCEGGGQQFAASSLNLQQLPKLDDGAVDYSKDFFSRPTYLTVSGQLNAEAMACALSDIYTFGPTFRAENSNTSRHLAEFWMIEPEMAFADLKDDMECAESYLKFILNAVLERCPQDLEFFDAFIEKGLIARLQHVASTPFAHLSYTEAIDILKKSGKTFEYSVEWGSDLQSEHERYLAEEYCKKPVILTDYPAKIKAFYMRQNPDGKTVAAMDVLVPKIGEIIGGSQREERYDLLKQKIAEFGLPVDDYWWYLQLRQYGSVPHAGFGAGFERLVLFATGMENIRDVIPFPRYPGHADF
jgi:asparaginyl-tRNA synthetase